MPSQAQSTPKALDPEPTMTESNDLRKRLADALDAIPVIDVHSHMRVGKPQADHLADILLYHHLGSELISAGLPADTIWRDELPHELVDPGIPPKDRVRSALPYLRRIRNTAVCCLLRTLLADLYDVPKGEIDESNLDEVWQRVAARAEDPTWSETLLRDRCGIAHSTTVEHLDTATPRPGFSFMSEGLNPFCLQDKAMDLHAAFERVQALAGCDIEDAASLRAGVETALGPHLDRGVLALTVWLPAGFVVRQTDASWLAHAIERLRTTEAGELDRDVFVSHALAYALDLLLERGPRRVQVFMGAEVKLPHRSISIGSGLFGRELCKIFGAYPDIRFELTTAAHVHTQDICIIAKHFPNVGVAGYWWHTLYPSFIREIIECRFDIVPSNKITAFFSDAYHAEWCYPKLKLVRRLLTDVLTAKVLAGDYSEDYAVELARQALYENPRDLYGITDPCLTAHTP